jgi:hypothetical protein
MAVKQEVKQVSKSDRIKAERDLLIQAFRLEKKNPKTGATNRIPKEYLNEKIWIKVEDPEVFRELFPNYLWFICQEIDEWFIVVKRSHPKLVNVESYKALKDELYKKYETQLLKVAFKNNITSEMIDKMNYFDLFDKLKELKLIEDEKKQ